VASNGMAVAGELSVNGVEVTGDKDKVENGLVMSYEWSSSLAAGAQNHPIECYEQACQKGFSG